MCTFRYFLLTSVDNVIQPRTQGISFLLIDGTRGERKKDPGYEVECDMACVEGGLKMGDAVKAAANFC